ncbi:collagen, type V, alpha 3b, partial [Tachysurus ichikawai]
VQKVPRKQAVEEHDDLYSDLYSDLSVSTVGPNITEYEVSVCGHCMFTE